MNVYIRVSSPSLPTINIITHNCENIVTISPTNMAGDFRHIFSRRPVHIKRRLNHLQTSYYGGW